MYNVAEKRNKNDTIWWKIVGNVFHMVWLFNYWWNNKHNCKSQNKNSLSSIIKMHKTDEKFVYTAIINLFLELVREQLNVLKGL